MLADIDGRLDFDDELPDLDVSLLVQKIEKMRQKVQQALKTEKRGKLLQTGIQVRLVMILVFYDNACLATRMAICDSALALFLPRWLSLEDQMWGSQVCLMPGAK